MRFIKQHGPECLLASLCMSNGMEKADYWRLRRGYDISSWQKAADTLDTLGFPVAADAVLAFSRQARGNKYVPSTGKPPQRLPRRRCTLIVRFEDECGKTIARHAVAVEDGRILDPEGTGNRETWAEFLKRWRGQRVNRFDRIAHAVKEETIDPEN